MNRGPTNFLRLALTGMSLVVLALCIFLLPNIFIHWSEEFSHLMWTRYPAVFALFLSAIFFWLAVYQLWNLLEIIDKNKAFSKASVYAMKNVKYCGLVISAIYLLWWPLIYVMAENDDAPGLILIFGAVFIGIPLVIAVFAGVAQKLFQNAIDIKKENDLTV